MLPIELVSIENEVPKTTSLVVAKFFGKRHGDILRMIRGLMDRYDSFKPCESRYEDKTGSFNIMYLLLESEANFLKDRINGALRVPTGLQEKAALDAIEQVLNIHLIRQFNVGRYRVDGYDEKNNIVYEIDEAQHRTLSHKRSDRVRQEFIQSKLGCKFVRINV